jgi:hypothetical protein
MTDSTAKPTFPSIAGWEEYNAVAVPLNDRVENRHTDRHVRRVLGG